MQFDRIGWIGTGVMGNSMCGHLLNAGHEAYVYNRTRSKAEQLIAKGAKWCSSPAEVAANCSIVFLIVGYPSDVEDTILGSSGLMNNLPEGSIIVDMTTSSPGLAEKIYRYGKAKGISSIDAPVSGGDLGAREATLSIMCGGDREVFDKIFPLLSLMGKNIRLMGQAGAGQHTKVSNQIAISTMMIGVIEALLYAQKAGLDQLEMIEVIEKGAAASWSLSNYGRRILNKNFNPGFYIKHFVKDMGIALDEARKMNLSLPGLSLANQFYIAAMAMGFDNLGTQALYKVLAKLNNLPD